MFNSLLFSLSSNHSLIVGAAALLVYGIAIVAKLMTDDKVIESRIFWISCISLIWGIFLTNAWYYDFFAPAFFASIPVLIFGASGIDSLNGRYR